MKAARQNTPLHGFVQSASWAAVEHIIGTLKLNENERFILTTWNARRRNGDHLESYDPALRGSVLGVIERVSVNRVVPSIWPDEPTSPASPFGTSLTGGATTSPVDAGTSSNAMVNGRGQVASSYLQQQERQPQTQQQQRQYPQFPHPLSARPETGVQEAETSATAGDRQPLAIGNTRRSVPSVTSSQTPASSRAQSRLEISEQCLLSLTEMAQNNWYVRFTPVI